MNKTIVITSIYQPFWGTDEFHKSCSRAGLPVHNAHKTSRFTGNGDAIRMIYEALVDHKDTYNSAIYADGADSIILKAFTPPPGCVIYSAEKAIWPPTDTMKYAWGRHYATPGAIEGFTDKFTGVWSTSPWKYLNGGGYCGDVAALIEFFERYGLSKLKGDVNGQDYQGLAFLKAQSEGFPIYLDTQCQFFQTTGFEDPGDFEYTKSFFQNKRTGRYPCILHGNGRTEMNHLYELLNR